MPNQLPPPPESYLVPAKRQLSWIPTEQSPANMSLLLFSPIAKKTGTYFNCIMFMVASSVVTTIMILNYHHRLADTHDMPPWVSADVYRNGWFLALSQIQNKILQLEVKYALKAFYRLLRIGIETNIKKAKNKRTMALQTSVDMSYEKWTPNSLKWFPGLFFCFGGMVLLHFLRLYKILGELHHTSKTKMASEAAWRCLWPK